MTVLTRDQGCRRDLLWRLHLPRDEVAHLVSALTRAGWEDRSMVPQVRDFESDEGHSVVFVPRTGRIQIRVFYLTAHAKREGVAHKVEAQIRAALAARTG